MSPWWQKRLVYTSSMPMGNYLLLVHRVMLPVSSSCVEQPEQEALGTYWGKHRHCSAGSQEAPKGDYLPPKVSLLLHPPLTSQTSSSKLLSPL